MYKYIFTYIYIYLHEKGENLIHIALVQDVKITLEYVIGPAGRTELCFWPCAGGRSAKVWTSLTTTPGQSFALAFLFLMRGACWLISRSSTMTTRRGEGQLGL